MKITDYSVIMTIFWSSILILSFFILRKKLKLIELCSVQGELILYIFCFVRMAIPLEFSWSRVIDGGDIYKAIYLTLSKKVHLIFDLKIADILYIIWAIGTIIFLVRYFHKYYLLNKIILNYSELRNESYHEQLKNLNIRIFESISCKAPFCTGIINKKIVLPKQEYSEKDLNYIILHEKTHLKNQDILIKVLVNVMCSIYWWNPIMYLLKKDMSQTLELRCDIAISENLLKQEKAEYMEALLNVFEKSNKLKNDFDEVSSGFVQNDIVERFQYISNSNVKHEKKKIILAYIISIILIIFSYSFIFQARFDAPVKSINTDENTYEINKENSYIEADSDENYFLVTPLEKIKLNDVSAKEMEKEGFEIKR